MHDPSNEFPPAGPARETKLRNVGHKETPSVSRSSQNVPPPWKVGDELGDFVLLAFLGKGSSGYVFRALDRVSDQTCALKIITETEPRSLVRIKQGFRRMSNVIHPNVVATRQIHNVGPHICLAMDEVIGETFASYVRRLAGGDKDQACNKLLHLTRQFGAALAEMHSLGFVHRDIKPGNMMVDQYGNGVLIDYGMVGTVDPEFDPHGLRAYIAGAPYYNAPEVLFRQYHIPSSDVFSLGLVLLEALQCIVQHSMVRRDEQDEVIDQEFLQDAISEIKQTLPDVMAETCEMMLESDPSDRITAIRVASAGLPLDQTRHLAGPKTAVGREPEHQAITQWVQEICQGKNGRLHLHGPPGIGKSKLIDTVVRDLPAMKWLQAFQGRCQRRENQPMQAFGQIADAIVARYSRDDMAKLEVDTSSMQILIQAFPCLEPVLCASTEYSSRLNQSCLDPLEAASRLSVALRKTGPLLIIIDDIQWADQDSLHVLDRLQTAPGVQLGIITVSRESDSAANLEARQQVPATNSIKLGPLSVESGIQILSAAADQWSLPCTPSVLRSLAEAAGGCPATLLDVCEEFKPGAVIADRLRAQPGQAVVSGLEDLHGLWRGRLNRLSQNAQTVMLLLSVADRPVSLKPLADLSGLGAATESVVSELVHQRLVTDSATGDECIAVAHDRISEAIIAQLKMDGHQYITGHKRWAQWLIQQGDIQQAAGLIATHLIEANQRDRAIRFAQIAATEALDRYAYAEAGHWHNLLIGLVSEAQQVSSIRSAASCYRLAKRPVKAAKYYQMLADLDTVSENERFDSTLNSLSLRIRSGHYDQVAGELVALAQRLRIPKHKNELRSKIAVLTRVVQLKLQKASNRLVIDSLSRPRVKQTGNNQRLKLIQRRLQFCVSLARPLSIVEGMYAGEMNLVAAKLAARYGTVYQKAHVLIGAAVFGSYNSGKQRIQAEQTLAELYEPICEVGITTVMGDWWAGKANVLLLSGDWGKLICVNDRLNSPINKAIRSYIDAGEPLNFEIASTRWLGQWGVFFLGRISWMCETSGQMIDEALHCRDLLAKRLATTGVGCAVWLAKDKPAEYRQQHLAVLKRSASKSPQLLDFMDWYSEMLCLLYEGRASEAITLASRHSRFLAKSPHQRMEVTRIFQIQITVLAMLQKYSQLNAGKKPARFTQAWRLDIDLAKRIRMLRREKTDFATTLAEFSDGVRNKLNGENQQAIQSLGAAADLARRLELRPIQYAAQDLLQEIEGSDEVDSGELCDWLTREQVVCPDKFRRLFTV